MDICEKQRVLFQNTYASLRSRIHPNGYAPTSVTGAYEGMFSRDASIQIMAHVACRDYEAARMLLSYIFSYHRQYGYDFALHMMLEDRPPYSDMVQADATFFLLHAWYLYAVHAPQSEEKERLLAQTEEQAVGFANYFLTPEFYRQDWNLLRNQNLEGPRQHSYFNCYDLLTNVYASQALHEFALYFARKRPSQAAHWEQTAQALRRGIHENLTAVVDGKPIYMEMHALTRNDGRKYHNIPHRKSYVGFSWVNLSVLGVKWFGADPALLENTYAAYRKYAFVPYDGGCLLPEHSSEYQSTGTCVLEKHHVLGKALAWELIYCHDTGRIQRVGEILDFVARCSDELYRESWNYAGGGRDAANQEHASWMVCAVRYALRKNAEIAEQTANEG